jgi:hypothetical protein
MRYYVCTKAMQDDQPARVHAGECVLLTSCEGKEFLGDYSSCHRALVEAKIHAPNRNICLCSECCPKADFVLDGNHGDDELLKIS